MYDLNRMINYYDDVFPIANITQITVLHPILVKVKQSGVHLFM